MYVTLKGPESGQTPALNDPDDFKAFKIVAPQALDGRLEEALGELGWTADESHAFLRIDGVRTLAERADDRAWNTQFDGMVAYATEKGWLDPTGTAIRAHVELQD
jgi:hypothetical protein